LIPLFSLLTIIVLSITTIRFGSVALELTGLTEEIAAFQAQSAFSGVGFTTEEAEQAVTHPVRRRIIRILMLLGSAGVSSSIATLILTFVNTESEDIFVHIGILFTGLAIIFLFSRSRYLSKVMKRVVVRVLDRLTDLRLYDYEQLLGLRKGFTVCRIKVKADSWMEGRRLKEIGLETEGVLILAIQRQVEGRDKFMGAPRGGTTIQAGDTLVCYSKQEVSQELSQRSKGSRGDEEHDKRVAEEKKRSRQRDSKGGYE
jgi:hypothetical protein